MLVTVCYDIPDDRRRLRVSRTLEGYGARVQRSVFECDVTEQQFAALQKRLRKVLHPQDDRVRYYKLCAACVERVEIDGPGVVHHQPLFYVV
ncbi:MAG: CRISPR-associated endonuclease Cas2 [Chloroflexi bacterium]|nr:CRISPR-associated endonuclease Cas2 [Chloroflexota bacterium]